jgi:hypothetical protein
MCVACLVVSALTFIVPVSDAPTSYVPQSATASAPKTLVRTQVSPGIAAVKKEIQVVLAHLPNSSDAEILRNGLKAASTRLNTATSDQQAQDILDEETDRLAEVVKKAPNAQQIADILLDIRNRADAQKLKNGTGAVELQSNAGFMLLQKGLQLHQRSGWLS